MACIVIKNLSWRDRVKCVACVDVIFSTFALVFTVTAIIVLGTIGLVRGVTLRREDILGIFGWIFLIISCFPHIITLWSALMLHKATKLCVKPKSAEENAKAWLYVNIIFVSWTAAILLVNILTISIVLWQCVLLVILLLFRGCLLYVVGEFVPELEQAGRHSRYALF